MIGTIQHGYREVSEWIPRLKEISRIYENMELMEQDRLVLLSTCSYEFDNARTVLTGRLVEMEGDTNAE
jgi:sortase B